MAKKKKEKKHLIFRPGLPAIVPKDDIPKGDIQFYAASIPPEIEPILNAICDTVDAYLKEAEKLLSGKYSSVKSLAPQHLINPGITVVLCSDEGVIIRYDSKVDDRGIAFGWVDDRFDITLPIISANAIYCHYPDNGPLEPKYGPSITLLKTSNSTGKSEKLTEIKIGFNIRVKTPPEEELPRPPHKPFCLLSAHNSFELNIIGELLDKQDNMNAGRRFMTRTLMKLPVGWECIEVFPSLETVFWNPDYAKIWAENDILATVVRKQARESELNSLDPNAAARKHYSGILHSYKQLLESDPDKEEILQVFLKEHPYLLYPTFLEMWPKLAIGAKKTDFVFKDATSDYVLVELEKSTDKLFIKSGDASAKLNHARDQILDWKRFIESNLMTVQNELGLVGISANPRSLIVIGRSKDLTTKNRRKLATIENDSPKLKIMTYDDVYENAKSTIENLLGPLSAEMGTTDIYYLP